MKLLGFFGLIGAWIQVHGSPIDAGGEDISVNIDPNSSLIIYDRTNLNQALIIAGIILLSIVLLGLLILTICWALRKFYLKSARVVDMSEADSNVKRSSTYRAGDHIRQKYGITPDGASLPKIPKKPTQKSKYGRYLTPPPNTHSISPPTNN
ncbi:hypothetical protein K7432_004636 [Basidiobolus ranarum]|uniref:Uncharacterized protein n=1 Tax=Basidiobolus ranarum TaxID=34480 RepID=A0ABR2W585_9FUNG